MVRSNFRDWHSRIDFLYHFLDFERTRWNWRRGHFEQVYRILSPLIYVVFGGMAIWAISAAGGLGPILSYRLSATAHVNPILVYFIIFNSVLAVWAAPGTSVSDFTQNAKSTAPKWWAKRWDYHWDI